MVLACCPTSANANDASLQRRWEIEVAQGLLKPILHQVESGKHIYSIIDGTTRYQYVLNSKNKEPKQNYIPRLSANIVSLVFGTFSRSTVVTR